MLNGKRHICDAHTAAKIWAHALAVGYRGRGIALEKMTPAPPIKQVGVLYGGDVVQLRTDPVLSGMIWGLEKFLARAGIVTIPLVDGEISLGRAQGKRSPFDAAELAIATVGEISAVTLTKLHAQPRRLVTLGVAFPDLAHAVASDDVHAAELLLGALKEAGHRAIGWFGGGMTAQSVAAKLRAVADAASRHEIAFHPLHASLFPISSREAGRQAAQRFLSLHAREAREKPTAIICSDARVARGALDICALHGVKVPDELSIVALDASCARTEENPAITAAGTDPETIGAAAGELLLKEPRPTIGHALILRPPAHLLPGDTLGAARISRQGYTDSLRAMNTSHVSRTNETSWRSDAA